MKLIPDKSDPSVSILGLWRTYLKHWNSVAHRNPFNFCLLHPLVKRSPNIHPDNPYTHPRSNSFLRPVRFQVMRSLSSFSGVWSRTSVGSVFWSRFPVYFHTLQQYISQIWNSMAHTVGAIENLDLIMRWWSREMQACEGISVQMYKPWCSPARCEGQIVLGLNPACTFQPNEV